MLGTWRAGPRKWIGLLDCSVGKRPATRNDGSRICTKRCLAGSLRRRGHLLYSRGRAGEIQNEIHLRSFEFSQKQPETHPELLRIAADGWCKNALAPTAATEARGLCEQHGHAELVDPREVGSSSRDGQPRQVKIGHTGGVAAGDPRIVVRGRLGLFVVRHSRPGSPPGSFAKAARPACSEAASGPTLDWDAIVGS